MTSAAVVGGGVYPGCGVWVGGWEGYYTGTQVPPSQDPYLTLIWPQDPTHGQMKLILEVSGGFSDKGLDMVQN